MRYQAHRALLWTGYTEEAAAIKPVWAGSGPAPDWTYLVDVRQACAEGRRDDAEELFGQLMELDEPSVVTQFLILLMLGREDEAYDVVRAVASEDVPYSLATFLGYGQFDVSQFPVLQQRLVEEGAERMLPIPVPYVCPPPT